MSEIIGLGTFISILVVTGIFLYLVKRYKYPSRKSKEIIVNECPHNVGYEVSSDGGGAQNFICARCGALVNDTPFGRVLLVKDARGRYPDAEKHMEVEAWKKEKGNING